MYNDDIGRRKVAISITHYAYRNTKLEDYHSDGVKMDKNFYRTIYNVVSSKLKNVRLLQRYLDDFPNENISDKQVLDKLIGSVPDNLQLKFIKYIQEIIFGQLYGTQWEPAKLVPEIAEGQSYANFVLAGKFSECCKNGCILDDAAMCLINKDVHNRIYTLLIGGYFNK